MQSTIEINLTNEMFPTWTSPYHIRNGYLTLLFPYFPFSITFFVLHSLSLITNISRSSLSFPLPSLSMLLTGWSLQFYSPILRLAMSSMLSIHFPCLLSNKTRSSPKNINESNFINWWVWMKIIVNVWNAVRHIIWSMCCVSENNHVKGTRIMRIIKLSFLMWFEMSPFTSMNKTQIF